MAKAFDKSSIKAKLGWSNSFNPDGAFPLDIRAWFGSFEEAQAAAQTAVEFGSTDSAYHFGQQLYVFDGTKATTYLIQGDKSLVEIGTGSGGTVHVVESKDELTSLSEAKVGEQAFVNAEGEDGGMYILTASPASTPENWTKVSSGVVWNTGKAINFWTGTQQQYSSVSAKDADTLYVVTDIGRIYKGSSDVTQCIKLVDNSENFPEAAQAIDGVLYIDKTSYIVKTVTPDDEYITVTPGYVTDGSNWAEATDDNKLATVGAIKTYVTSKIEKITEDIQYISEVSINEFDKETGKFTLSVTKNGTEVPTTTDVTLTDVAYKPTLADSTLTIKMYGGEDVVVNFSELIKDKFVSGAEYKESYPEGSDEQHQHNVIVLTLNEGDPVVIPVGDLIDTYTAKEKSDSDNIEVKIEAKEVSASLIITSLGEGNTILTVDESGKLVATTPADAVGEAIASAIESATTSEGVLKTALDAKLNKLESGTEDEIILSKADGSIKRSGTTIADLTVAWEEISAD